jgi:hypothetical protein
MLCELCLKYIYKGKLRFNQRGADAPFTPVNLFFLKRKDSKENRFDEK